MPLKKKGAGSDLPAVKKERRPLYGWITAIASAGTVLAACNVQYSFGVFLKPLIDEFGWSRTAISGSVSVRSLVTGLTAPITGALSDRHGARPIVIIGIVLARTGYLLSSQIASLWHLYLFFATFMGLAMSTVYTPAVATVTKWFGAKAALASFP